LAAFLVKPAPEKQKKLRHHKKPFEQTGQIGISQFLSVAKGKGTGFLLVGIMRSYHCNNHKHSSMNSL
jgi:hypothetical protein